MCITGGVGVRGASRNERWLVVPREPHGCSMKNSKSDGWILQVDVAGNQYPHERSRYGAELSIVPYLVAFLHYVHLEIAAVYFMALSPV